MEPFFFGPPERRLFGCYHPPAATPPAEVGFVYCSPVDHDYVRFHRAGLGLCRTLAKKGIAALRCDLFGTGDSAGLSEQCLGLAGWMDDVRMAVEELRRRRGNVRICLFGIRLSGSLAIMASANHLDIDSVVLWDPVYDGQAYLDELSALHREMVLTTHVVENEGDPPGQIERLGWRLSDALVAEIAGTLRLEAFGRKPARKVLIIATKPRVSQLPLVRHLSDRGVDVTSLSQPSPELWTWTEDFGAILVPQVTLRSIATWVEQVYG